MTLKVAEALHKKYAPTQSAFELVFTHCQIIWQIAAQLIEKNDLDVDIELVKAGCLVHDIGLYRLIDEKGNIHPQHVKHGILGYELLKDEGYPEELCRFASHHTGVGLTAKDVREQGLPLPVQDYLAESDEELLLMYADKFHSKNQPPCFVTYDWYKQYVSGFGKDKVVRFERMAKRFGTPNLSPLIKKYDHSVKSV